MTNNNQTAPVTDEELDQMILKLERDGMTPKQLSLMRELLEVRRAKGEPVAWIVHARTGDQLTTDSGYVANAEGILGLHSTPLYTAQPAPVVPDVIATDDIPYSVGRFRTHRDCYRDGWNACIAAMQSDGTLTNEDTMQASGNSEQLEPVSNRDELPAKCWCQTCRPVTMNDMRFVVCPECGNKRCPRANDHCNACTGSNAPGQDGSAYPAAPKEVQGE